MTNVYIMGEFLNDKRYVPVLYPNLGVLVNENRIFADRGNRAMRFPVVEIVKNIKEADFILLPHEYFDVVSVDKNYLQKHIELARQSGKKLLIFDFSDFTEREIDVPEAVIFRIAGYRGRIKDNVVIMPTFVEDLAQYGKIFLRNKGDKPIIGFCGWANVPTIKQKIKLFIKNLLIDLQSAVTRETSLKAHKRGIYFRMQVIRALRMCRDVINNFIIRSSYSSHINTIELSLEEARRQYVNNILSSDLALAVRGDANASCRFFEILSLGRVPLFLDTDCVLPLADEIDYKKFIVFVDYKKINRIGETVYEFWKSISDEEFIAMQKAAREAFEKYLRVDSFFAYILPKLIHKGH